MGDQKKVTIRTLEKRKTHGERIAMLTCYDYPTAQLLAEADVDVILVGDTYAEVCLGHTSTLPATMEVMLSVTAAVRKGAPHAFLLGDMPYLSYQACNVEAIHNAGRFMAEAGCDAVKIEVDAQLADTVAAMHRATIPVVAHLGLKPQSIHQIGGYKGQGKTAEAARRLIDEAKMMEQAGACMLLLECVPSEVARIISHSTQLPVIGIAAGPYVDGQVMVLHDMLGYTAGHPPKSVKRYADLRATMVQAFQSYKSEVLCGEFPTETQSPKMEKGEFEKLQRKL